MQTGSVSPSSLRRCVSKVDGKTELAAAWDGEEPRITIESYTKDRRGQKKAGTDTMQQQGRETERELVEAQTRYNVSWFYTLHSFDAVAHKGGACCTQSKPVPNNLH